MFDDITESVKAFVSEALLAFAVAAFIANILIRLANGDPFDIMAAVQLTVTAVLVGIFISVVIGALRAATK
jgi:hypothetical protein